MGWERLPSSVSSGLAIDNEQGPVQLDIRCTRQCRIDLREAISEKAEQICVRYISDSKTKQSSWATGENLPVAEIDIFADDYAILFVRHLPDRLIRCLVTAGKLSNMFGVMPLFLKPTSQPDGQIRVDEKSHCCAASVD